MNCYENSSAVAALSPDNHSFSLNPLGFILPSLCAILFLVHIKQQSIRAKSRNLPPQVPGLPFLGSAIDFQGRAVDFLFQCRRSFGDLFTIRLPFNRMHVLMDIHSLDAFSKHRHFDFDPIQEMVNRNVFSFALPDSHQMMRAVTRFTKKSQMIEVVDRYAIYVGEGMDILSEEAQSGWTQRPLRELMIDNQFRAIFNTIFGRSDDHAFNAQLVSSGLDRFHKAFNFLWLGFPCWLFPDPHAALKSMLTAHPEPEELISRQDASAYIRAASEKLIELGGDRNVVIGHNLVYTHINFNTMKITYWAVAQLAAHPEALAEVRQEAMQLIKAGCADMDSTTEVLLEDICNLPILDSVVKECFRLSSGVLMVREVTETSEFKPRKGPSFTLTAGDKVAMYPPAIHLDPEIFESPYEFRFDRFIDAEFHKDGQRVSKPILAYGLLCPGQHMSIAQVKVFLFSFVTSFDFRFDEGVPQYNRQCYGHEILPVIKDRPLSYRTLPERRRLLLRFA